MADLNDIYTLLQSIQQNLLQRRNSSIPPADVKITKLSDMSTSLGLVQSGEFRSGNRIDPGKGFSGVRIAWPPMSYSGSTWNIVGVNNDVLQFGIRAIDGVAFAGGGAVLLDEGGITVYTLVIGQTDSQSYKFADANDNVQGGLYGFTAGATSFSLGLYTSGDVATESIIIGANAVTTASISVGSSIIGSSTYDATLTFTSNTTQPNISMNPLGKDVDLKFFGTHGSVPILQTNAGAGDLRVGTSDITFQGESYGGTWTGISMIESTAVGSTPTANTTAHVYIRGNSFVIQWNDGGTVRYKYLDLTGTGVTWTHSTTSP